MGIGGQPIAFEDAVSDLPRREPGVNVVRSRFQVEDAIFAAIIGNGAIGGVKCFDAVQSSDTP